ncbi:unnamed protein product, partial [Didymodactylos carnosus]
GHGGTTPHGSYLVTNDNKMLISSELSNILRTAKTNKIILMFDSCYAGGMSNPFIWGANMCKEGIHILCASRGSELSYQGDTNGIFTKYLIQGLRGEYHCRTNNCPQCTTRTTNLRQATIQKVTSTELSTYLTHAVSGRQNFAYTAINGSEFDISFIN